MLDHGEFLWPRPYPQDEVKSLALPPRPSVIGACGQCIPGVGRRMIGQVRRPEG